MTKRMLPKPTTASDMLTELCGLMTGESDRGCVLIGHGMVEAQLGELITRHLLRMSGARKLVRRLLESLIGSFRNRVTIARAMGLIEEPLASALLEFNTLRNKIAHDPYTTVDTGLVNRTFDKLDPAIRSAIVHCIPVIPPFSQPRTQFMGIAATLMFQLRLAINDDKRRLRLIAKALEPTVLCLPLRSQPEKQ